MVDLIVNTSITHSLLLILPVGCALLLRWARCPGWPVVGGVMAGLLLGPGILGRVAPSWHEASFVGAIEQHEARDALVREREREIAVMSAAGADASEIEQVSIEFQGRIDAANDGCAAERWRFQRPLRSYAATISALALLGAGLLRSKRNRSPSGWVAPLSVGAWSALLPGALGAAAAMFWWDAPRAEAILIGAAVAIGPCMLTSVDREAADRAEIGGAKLVERAGRVASLLAIAATIWAVWRARSISGLVWTTPLLALLIGWLLPFPRESMRRFVQRTLEIAVVPALAACASLRIDLLEHASLWPLLVLILLSGDARWLGAFTGAMVLGGRKSLRTMRLVLGAMAAGPTQLAITALAVQSNLIAGEYALALVAGAVMIEVTVPTRRSMAKRLTETEQEIEELRDEE